MTRLTDARLKELLKCVSEVMGHPIPSGSPCFWDEDDEVACTYDELRSALVELVERRWDEKEPRER